MPNLKHLMKKNRKYDFRFKFGGGYVDLGF